MKALYELNHTAEEMLGGLQASERMRLRVLENAKAGREEKPTWIHQWMRFAPTAAAIVLVVGISILGIGQWNLSRGGDLPPDDGGEVQSISAGMATSLPAPPEGVLIGIAGMEEDGLVVSGADAPEYRSLFASGSGANYPLVGLGGNAYRQLQVGVSESQLGGSLGTVSLYTDEPSLADASAWSEGVLSNVVPEGTEVYQVSGISSSTAVAAQVDGSYRLFQRVSYAGHGIAGQSLENTLDVRGKVSALSLSGVGRIDDSARANAMMSLLLDNASFYSDDSLRGNQSLDIHLQSGLTLQLQIADGVFSACGSWTCSEFFTEYANMLSQ